MRKLPSVQRVVLNGVVVRQITTYVHHICRTASGGERDSEVCMGHARRVYVCAWEELSGPDRVSLHDKQLLRAGMRTG